MVSLDDSRLTELAAEPPGRLLPVLDRAAAMAPLVVLMAVLPGLTALVLVPPESPVAGAAVAEVTSPWGRFLAEQPWRGWLAEDELTVSWLPVVPSYLSAVILVWIVWHAAGGLFGARTGVLAALMVCCHTPVVMLGRSSEPLALSAVVATASVTGFIAHLQRRRSSLSLPLLVSMLGLAATVLLASPLVWSVLVLLSVALVCHPTGELGVWGNGSAGSRTRIGGRWHGPVSGLVVIGGAGLLVGAWILWSGNRESGPGLLASAGRGFSGWPTAVQRIGWLGWLGWLSWLSGPVLLGIVDVVRGVVGGDRSARPVAVLAAAWALLVPVSVGLAEDRYPLRLVEAFAVIPLGVLAARGIESICERRVGVAAVVAATVISGCLGTDHLLETLSGGPISDPWLRLGLVLAVALVAGLGAAIACRGAELYRRRMLLGCIALVLVAQLITGWFNVVVSTDLTASFCTSGHEKITWIDPPPASGPQVRDVGTWRLKVH